MDATVANRSPREVVCNEKSYRTMATFSDSDENFMIYRRFGYLHARTLLRLQDKLRVLEHSLDLYDDEDAADSNQKRLLSCREADEVDCEKRARDEPDVPTRTQILNEIEDVLKRYGIIFDIPLLYQSLTAPR